MGLVKSLDHKNIIQHTPIWFNTWPICCSTTGSNKQDLTIWTYRTNKLPGWKQRQQDCSHHNQPLSLECNSFTVHGTVGCVAPLVLHKFNYDNNIHTLVSHVIVFSWSSRLELCHFPIQKHKWEWFTRLVQLSRHLWPLFVSCVGAWHGICCRCCFRLLSPVLFWKFTYILQQLAIGCN